MDEFDRHFWQHIYDRLKTTCFVADGHAYTLGPKEDCAPQYKGFGGARWLIRWPDGSLTCTDNLWHRGEVPEELRDKFPDNAILMNEDGVPMKWRDTGRTQFIDVA